MGVPLVTFAREFIVNRERLLATLKRTPIVVWEAASLRTREDREGWLPTDAGQQMVRPTKGEAVAYRVEKQPGVNNAFSMGITVGRIESNDIILDDVSISRFHAYFQYDERKHLWTLSDADSRNGTFINEKAVRKDQKAPLSDGDAVRFGEVPVRFFMPEGLMKYLDALGA